MDKPSAKKPSSKVSPRAYYPDFTVFNIILHGKFIYLFLDLGNRGTHIYTDSIPDSQEEKEISIKWDRRERKHWLWNSWICSHFWSGKSSSAPVQRWPLSLPNGNYKLIGVPVQIFIVMYLHIGYGFHDFHLKCSESYYKSAYDEHHKTSGIIHECKISSMIKE